jgi:hypothetical protein
MARPPGDRDDEGFASRWSRLKQQSRVVAPPAPVAQAVAPIESEDPAVSEKKAPDAEKPFDPSTLPPVESLTKESDYSAFMRAEVPEDLRQKALRRLWASDPVLSAPEILDMHNLDYNNVPTFPQGLRTLYRVGRGMLDAVEAEAEKQAEKEKQQAAAVPEGEVASLPARSDAASQQETEPSAEQEPEKSA